jgi:hypothetical protein
MRKWKWLLMTYPRRKWRLVCVENLQLVPAKGLLLKQKDPFYFNYDLLGENISTEQATKVATILHTLFLLLLLFSCYHRYSKPQKEAFLRKIFKRRV